MAGPDVADIEKGDTARVGSDVSTTMPDTPRSSWLSSLGSKRCGSVSDEEGREEAHQHRRSAFRAILWILRNVSRRHSVAVTKVTTAQEPLVRSLNGCLKGYNSLATFLDSDENFMIYRRFGYVQARLLLEKQDELRRLEEKLDYHDKTVAKNRATDLQSRDLRPEAAEARRQLMQELGKTFNEYAALLSSAQQLVALHRPADHDYQSLISYISRNDPLRPDDQKWVRWREDLVTLRPGREHAWLDTMLEHLLKLLDCAAVRNLFCSKETKEKGDGVGVYFTRSRIDKLVSGIITVMILVLLIVPVFVLYHLVNEVGTHRTDPSCVGVLLVFTLAFSTALSLFTRAKRHEILGAAAAYCAVLVVFLGNVGPGNS